jgi:membrane-bound inhibitor of C-type lysozyme
MRRWTLIVLFAVTGVVAGQARTWAQTFVTYHCRDGSEFVVAFFAHDRRAHLQLDGKAVVLPRRVSLSGSRYAKGDIAVRINKTATTLRRGKRSTECTAR